jgi:hypothetical protein
MTTQTLAPGSQARIYRDGGTLVAACLVPDEGRFEVRGLLPGQYVARDEMGGERAFEVRVGEEVAVVSGQGTVVPPGASGLPGTGSRVDAPPLNVGAAPVFRRPGQVAPGVNVTTPIANESADVETVPPPPRVHRPENPVEDDVRVPGGPGSALIQDDALPVNVGRVHDSNLAPAEQELVDAAERERDRAEAA